MTDNSEPLSPVDLYDGLASTYKFTYTNWDKWREGTRVTLEHVVRECCTDAKTILDCAAGIGTQSLVLAEMGYEVTATDISVKMIAELEAEAAKRKLRITTKVCPWQELRAVFPGNYFDVVICFGNCLPHLPDGDTTRDCLKSMLACLRPGGHLIFNMQDYDKIILERPGGTSADGMPESHYNPSYYQTWEWVDSERFASTWYIKGKAYCSTMMRAITESEILDVCNEVGAECVIKDDANYFKIFVVRKGLKGVDR